MANRQKTYVAIINAVKTPISFLVLIVLVVEGLFLTLATSHDTVTHVVGIIGGVGVLILAAAIVSAFEWLRPGTLSGSGRSARPDDENLPRTVPADKFRVLCVAGSHTDGAQQYSTADIIKHYGFDVTHLTSATFDTLRTSLLNTKYDLVHFDVIVARNKLILSDDEMLPQLLSSGLNDTKDTPLASYVVQFGDAKWC
jgi:hypothetical protein